MAQSAGGSTCWRGSRALCAQRRVGRSTAAGAAAAEEGEGHSPGAQWEAFAAEQSEAEVSPEESDALELAVSLAECIGEYKAEDIRVLHVAPVAPWCTAFVIASIFSRPQLEATLQGVDEYLRANFNITSQPQGKSSWCIIDLQSVVVHLMTPSERGKYELDAQYSEAAEVELPFVVEQQESLPTSI